MIDWLAPLDAVAESPVLYLPLLFAFTVLATIVLPVPVEVALLNPFLPPASLILVLAAGKAVGAAFVFPLGGRIGDALRSQVARFPRFARFYGWVERFVGRRGYVALFLLLSVPFMTDTAPLYAFTMLNPSRTRKSFDEPRSVAHEPRGLVLGPFVAVNFAAGVVRGTLFLVIPLLLGWR